MDGGHSGAKPGAADIGMVNQSLDQAGQDELAARQDIAAACRLVDLYGWSDLLANHISARINGTESTFLVNPYGLLFEQVTASSLVKIDGQGRLIGTTPYVLNPAAFIIHGAIYESRPDVQAIIHLHTRDGVAVSTQRDGLLPVTQHALAVLHQVAYHEYEGISTDPAECERIAANLGQRKLLIMRNHGTLSAGRSIGEAFALMHRLERACRMQIAAQSGGVPLRQISSEVAQRSIEQGRAIFSESGFAPAGILEWAALRRKLDAADTGYQA